MSTERRIGLFGGTFDPVHNGHLSIANDFLESGYIDELWVLLTPQPPHKRENHKSDYQLRLEMLEKAFRDWDRVKISTIERALPQPSYTVRTLEHLSKEYPLYTFYLCLGGDSYRNFHHWYEYRAILRKTQLLVAHRPGADDVTDDEEVRHRSIFVEHEPVDISSTMIREKVRVGKSVDDLVPEAVTAIINREHLYQKKSNV